MRTRMLAAMAGLRGLAQRPRELAPAAVAERAVQAVERVQEDGQVPGRRRHEVHHVLVEGDEPDAVALLAGEIGQAGGQRSGRSRAW